MELFIIRAAPSLKGHVITFAKITFGKKVDLVKLISERDKPENVIKKSGQYFGKYDRYKRLYWRYCSRYK